MGIEQPVQDAIGLEALAGQRDRQHHREAEQV